MNLTKEIKELLYKEDKSFSELVSIIHQSNFFPDVTLQEVKIKVRYCLSNMKKNYPLIYECRIYSLEKIPPSNSIVLEQEEEITSDLCNGKLPSRALILSGESINALKKIRPNDPKRKEAFLEAILWAFAFESFH